MPRMAAERPATLSLALRAWLTKAVVRREEAGPRTPPKCGDRRVRTPLNEAANVTLTRFKGEPTGQEAVTSSQKRETLKGGTRRRSGLCCSG